MLTIKCANSHVTNMLILTSEMKCRCHTVIHLTTGHVVEFVQCISVSLDDGCPQETCKNWILESYLLVGGILTHL